jgi:hypothetical protein
LPPKIFLCPSTFWASSTEEYHHGGRILFLFWDETSKHTAAVKYGPEAGIERFCRIHTSRLFALVKRKWGHGWT